MKKMILMAVVLVLALATMAFAANVYKSNIIVLDTFSSAIDVQYNLWAQQINQQLKIKSIVWAGATTANHTATIKTGDGTVIFAFTCASTPCAPQQLRLDGLQVDNIKVDQSGVQSGTIYIYLER